MRVNVEFCPIFGKRTVLLKIQQLLFQLNLHNVQLLELPKCWLKWIYFASFTLGTIMLSTRHIVDVQKNTQLLQTFILYPIWLLSTSFIPSLLNCWHIHYHTLDKLSPITIALCKSDARKVIKLVTYIKNLPWIVCFWMWCCMGKTGQDLERILKDQMNFHLLAELLSGNNALNDLFKLFFLSQ